MTRNCDDLWLLISGDVYVQEHLANALGCLIPIEERHVAVHQYQRESKRVVLRDCCLDLLYCLFSVVGKMRHFLAVLDTQDHEKAKDNVAVEFLVVHY